MSKGFSKEYYLTLESINEICEELDAFFEESQAQKKDAIRIKYMTEETLLKYRDRFGEDIKVELHTSQRLLKVGVQLTVYSEKYNPFVDGSGDEGLLSSMISASKQQAPRWQYVKSSFDWLFDAESKNVIVFQIPRRTKTSSPAQIAICLGLGTIIALLLRFASSAESCNLFANDYLLPFANAYTGLLSVFAILLVFFSLPLCIVQYGSAAEFENTTKRLLRSYVMYTAVFAVVATIISVQILGFDKAASESSGLIAALIRVFTSFIPSNLIAPFVNFDCMQVMIIGLMFGFAFLAMGNSNKVLVDIFDKCNLVAVLANGFLTKFISIYVGIMACYLILTSSLDFISRFGLIFIMVIGISVLAFVLFSAAVCFKLKVAPSAYVKKLMPAFMVSLSSASVGAAFMVFFNELTGDCGVELSYTGMAANLGTILFKPMYSVYLAVSSLMVAHLTGTLTLQLAIQILVLAIVLPATIPNIPGGAASVIVLMLDQLGMGNQYAEIFVSINVLLQYIIIPMNIFCMQSLIVLCAAHSGKVDLDILRKQN